jgi:four helix bundle protein
MSTDHRTLKAFHMADEFVIRVYGATQAFHPDERFGMRSQIRRAAVSIPTNIVEGCARDSDREHLRFYEIALGSARETIYLLDLAGRLGLMDRDVAEELAGTGDRLAAGLGALRRSMS